jgi:hypothetical protein
MSLVVVEQLPTRPMTPSLLREALLAHAGCHALYGVRHVQSVIAESGDRMICLFETVDAESVRIIARKKGYRYQRAWNAQIYQSIEPLEPR